MASINCKAGGKYSLQNQEEAENWGIRSGEGTRLFSQTVLGKTRLAPRDALTAPCSPCPPPPLPFSFSTTHKWTYSCSQHVYKPQHGDILNKPLSLFGPYVFSMAHFGDKSQGEEWSVPAIPLSINIAVSSILLLSLSSVIAQMTLVSSSSRKSFPMIGNMALCLFEATATTQLPQSCDDSKCSGRGGMHSTLTPGSALHTRHLSWLLPSQHH